MTERGTSGLLTRARVAADLDVLVPLLLRVHLAEGYPVRREAVSAAWLTSSEKPGVAPRPELGGWVAEESERVLGHVGLHPPGEPCLAIWTAATGRDAAGIAVLSRLFTDRTVAGAGSALIFRAVNEARLRGLAPVLEVDSTSPAYAFYLRRGWTEAGRAPQQWGPRLVDSAALLAPA